MWHASADEGASYLEQLFLGICCCSGRPHTGKNASVAESEQIFQDLEKMQGNAYHASVLLYTGDVALSAVASMKALLRR